MKWLLGLAVLLLSFSITAQKSETYYDYNWKPSALENARFFSTVEKTDSGWLRKDYFIGNMQLQMQVLYEDSECKFANGFTLYLHSNGISSTVGRMVHNKREGVCVSYYSNGMMSDSATYHNGRPVGNHYQWHRNGYLADSTGHVNDSMDVAVGWFDDGALSYAGYLLSGKMHGKWKYFHRNGSVSAEEIYEKGAIISKNFFNENGSTQPDTAKVSNEAVFKNGGSEGWRKYMEKNLYWPEGFALKNTSVIVVPVSFTVDEEGKLQDAEVVVPFHPEFDKIALRIIKSSPPWKPARAHNRNVKFFFRQPVTFQQIE